jgi:Flp pilus assembly protein CpaB
VDHPGARGRRADDDRDADGEHGAGREAMMRGVLIGAAVGLVLAIVASGAGAVSYAAYQAKAARKGWVLKPAVVTGRDVKRGEGVAGAVVLREIPEQFATESLVAPASIGAVQAQRFALDLPAGVPVRHSDFASGNQLRTCAEEARPR